MNIILQPPSWSSPKGFSNGILTPDGHVFIAGQIGWNSENKFESSALADQTQQALRNIIEILHLADGKPSDIVRMTWYVTDKQEYLSSSKEIGKIYREIMGNHYPVMSLIPVAELLEDQAKVEIEATAVLTR